MILLKDNHIDFAGGIRPAIEGAKTYLKAKGKNIPIECEVRSLMNVPFVTGNEELDAKFVAEAKAAGLENLKGHRTVGGMRASIYNAMPIEGVKALVEFMEKFEKENA